MSSCAIPMCKNKSGQSNGNENISFHRFPTDEETKKLWVDVVKKCRLQESWTPDDHSVICSAHFDTNNILKTPFLTIITKGSVPTKNIETEVIDLTEDKPTVLLKKTVSEQPADDGSLSDVDISDLDHIFDTPAERQLRLQIHRRIKSIYKLRRKLKALQKTNMDLIKNKKDTRESIVKYVENYLLEKLQTGNGSNETIDIKSEAKPS